MFKAISFFALALLAIVGIVCAPAFLLSTPALMTGLIVALLVSLLASFFAGAYFLIWSL